MPRFAANLSFLFKEHPFIERFAASLEAGFNAVEVLFPYDTPGSEIREVLSITGQQMVLINTPPPNYSGGARGFAAIPGGQDRFQYDFRRSLRYAQALGATHLHIMAGAAEGAVARQVYIDNLKWAADFAPDQSLTIEPINQTDLPGYFLSDFDLAIEVLDAVNAPNLNLQFDAYHAHILTGDVLDAWDKYGSRTTHVQVADPNGRSEPTKGDVDFPAFFAQLDASGYQGVVSAEYHPIKDTAKGLTWMQEAQAPG